MRKVQILDCTLRDGGCVNDFNFGNFYMRNILNAIEKSGIEIVELGYIDSQYGAEKERTKYSNERVIYQNFLTEKKSGVQYVAMVDYGKYDPEQLEPKNDNSIDAIRLAFHKKNRKDILSWGRKILDKGYGLYVQPMTCLRYTDSEMLDLISDVNEQLPDATAFYIVDSFGEMRLNDVNRMAYLVDHNLNSNIKLGLHSHNNLQLSYSNAVTLLNHSTERELIIDTSILGMGKGAGNLNTEIFAEHLNLYENKNYDITFLLEVIDKAINQLKEKYAWGYSIEYYLSAANHCTPSYASHFYKKHMLSVDQVAELLGMIAEDKKVSFDRGYADELYFAYNSKKYDDRENLKKLRGIFTHKKVLLIAPGRSVLEYKSVIDEENEKENVISIALNNNSVINTDYIFVTKMSTYEIAKTTGKPIIVTSNVNKTGQEDIIINYSKFTNHNGYMTDNSSIMLITMLKQIGVQDISLAGFDGFSTNVDANYYDESLKRPVTKEKADERNLLMTKFLNEIKETMNITYMTPSLYHKE